MNQPTWNPRALTLMLLAITLILVWLLVLLLTSAPAQVTAARKIEPLRPVASEIEPNDTPTIANPVAINEDMLGRIPVTNTSDIDFFVLTTEVGGAYEVRLEEWPTSANYRLNLRLFDGELMLVDVEYTSGGDAVLDWTAQGTEYYLSVDALEIDLQDALYAMRVVRLAPTPQPQDWDACEINDSLIGTWSGQVPPGGPCSIPVGALYADLNFVPYTGQPSPNPDFFQVFLKINNLFQVETKVTPGVDTVIYLYAPGATDDSQYIASSDDAPGLGLGSRILWAPDAKGVYIIKVLNQEPTPHERDETYNLSVTFPTLLHAYLPIVVKTPPSR